MTTPIKAQTISRQLAKAGFERSRTIKMRVASRSTDGFRVTQRYDDTVYVSYSNHNASTLSASYVPREAMIERLRTTLTFLGYTVVDGETWQAANLVVTKA